MTSWLAHYRDLMQVWIAAIWLCVLAGCATQPALSPEEVTPPRDGEGRTVALLGATGMVGGYLLEEALARGYQVRALARRPEKLEVYRDRITVVQGNALDRAVVEQLVQGSDVVISALGPVKADGDAALFVNTKATDNVITAMGQSGAGRYIAVSGAAVQMPGDERDLLGWWVRTLAGIGLADALRDKQSEYTQLAGSDIDWMLVRCPLIDPEPFVYPALVSVKTPPAFRVRAGELSRFIFDEVVAGEYSREGPFVGSRPR